MLSRVAWPERLRINITMASKATLRQAFEQFDTDRSGKLSTDEV